MLERGTIFHCFFNLPIFIKHSFFFIKARIIIDLYNIFDIIERNLIKPFMFIGWQFMENADVQQYWSKLKIILN